MPFAMPLPTIMNVLSILILGVTVLASPVSRRDVISPKILSPTATTVWVVGKVETVTWDTSNLPPVSRITNPIGQVILGLDTGDSLNLDFNHPLASGFNITDGSVNFTVPNVIPRKNYLIVLFGDSGNASPDFAISGGTVSTSTSVGTSTHTTLNPFAPPASDSSLPGGPPSLTNAAVLSSPGSSSSLSQSPTSSSTSSITSLTSSSTSASLSSTHTSLTSTTKAAATSAARPGQLNGFTLLSLCMASIIMFIMI